MLQRTHSFTFLMAVTSLAVPLGFLNDWFVDQNAPNCATGTGGPQDPFCTITRALDAASDGDRVLIAPGTYTENLLLAKDLDLIGTAGRAVTIIDGSARTRTTIEVAPGTTGTLSGLTFTGGRSNYGGGLLVEDATLALPTSLILTDSTVTRNVAPDGGGIFVGQNCQVGVHGCEISENVASGASVAGVFNKGTLTITNSSITGNVSEEPYSVAGIAIHVDGPCSIENTLIAENRHQNAALEAWTIYAVGAPLSMTNCTVAFNGPFNHQSTTDHVALQGSNAIVKNSIFRGNAGPETRGAIVSFSCVDDWGGGGVGNIDAAPLFVNPVTGRYDLQPGSPCIDAGDPSARRTGVDHDGNPRVLDGRFDRVQRIDMGYVEFANVHLRGEVLPTHELTLSTPRSTFGLTLFLIGGLGAGEANFAPWGPLFVAPGTLAFIEPIGTTPTRQTYAIPPSLFGTDAVLQLLALGAPLGSGRRPGNFSNAVALTLE